MTNSIHSTTKQFAQALQGLVNPAMVVGEKGTPMYESTGQESMDWHLSINQSTPVEDIVLYLEKVLITRDPRQISDLVIAIINKRHPRHGEGCKATGIESLLQLYEQGYKQLVIKILEFIPEFGCFKESSSSSVDCRPLPGKRTGTHLASRFERHAWSSTRRTSQPSALRIWFEKK